MVKRCRKKASRKKASRKGTSEQKACRGEESCRPARPAAPTLALPGSEAKIDVLAERASKRQSLFVAGDATDTDDPIDKGQWLGMMLLAGVHNAVSKELDSSGDMKRAVREGMKVAERGRRHVTRLSDDVPKPEGCAPEPEAAGAGKLNPGAAPGDRIRMAREAAGVSRADLARLLGTSRSHLIAVESCEKTPCSWTLYRVARELRVSLDWLACLRREAGAVVCLCA